MADDSTPRTMVIHPSINRPNQLLGGDRELVLITALTATTLGLSLGSWWGVCLSVMFWIGAIAVLQRMGKADPLLRQVYLRHIRYRQFYPAKRTAFCLCTGEGELEMMLMNSRDWPPDQQIALEEIMDYSCHRMLVLISPHYRALEALADARAKQIVRQMRDAILKLVKEGEWLTGAWLGEERAQEIKDAILKYLGGGDWHAGRVTPSDYARPNASGNVPEQ